MFCWLIVDDSDLIRKVMRKVLEDLNYMVIEAESGQQAIAKCAKAMPEVIVLDWHMPDMTGHEVLMAIKDMPADRRPVICYCTTQNDPMDISRAFSLGAETYLMKPFNREVFTKKISEVMLLAA